MTAHEIYIEETGKNTKDNVFEYVQWLENKVEKMHEIGEFFVPPRDWNCFKNGGMPPIDYYESMDLSDL